MITWKRYDTEVDIWSTGCILAEMLAGKPLFPGIDSTEQLDMITELLGSPSTEAVRGIGNEDTKRALENVPRWEHQTLHQRFEYADPLAVGLLEKMLLFEPQLRISAEEALRHNYISRYHDPVAEPVAERIFDWSFNNDDLTVDAWRVKM
ncbi:hypothetical protein EYZ11_010749 [Aspergillus tanneri]|nr:hypothetical protein EYZ11_010749 [Aspergillus tanneri]